MKKTYNCSTPNSAASLSNLLLWVVLALLLPLQDLSAQCSPDTEAPLCVAPPNVHFTEQEFAALDIDFFNMPDDLPKVRAACGSVYHWDNCSNGDSQVQESFYISEGTPTAPQQVQRRFFVTDAAGNLSEGVQYILISSPFSMHVPAYRYPNDTETDSMRYVGGFGHELYPPEDSVFAAPCPGGYSKIERSRFLIDWIYVSSTGNDAEVVLPALDLNNDGITGDAYDIIAIDDSIWLNINNVPTQKLSRRGAIYTYKQFLYNSYILRGVVHLDTLQNCALDSGEPPLAGMQVKVIGQVSNNVYTAVTDASGAYELLVCTNDTLVEVGLDVPYNYGGSCGSTYLLGLADGPPAVRNIPVPLTDSCNLLTVDIATWRLRPCFNSSYTVNYCNYSSHTIEDTYVEVALDSLLAYTASSIPGTLLSGNTYRFETGDLDPGVCGQFTIQVLVDCAAPVGLTHCTEAHIFPTDDCPTASPWSGANLRVTGYCEGDSVRLQIKNIGMGAMVQSLDFVVTEDLIMAKTSPFQLGAGGTLTVSEPSNGSTWRLEAPQEPGHPWGGVVTTVVEGCGGLNTVGLVNIFPVNDNDPFSSTDCTENTSSYDPNDKQAFPKGYGTAHYIRANTDIEYLIRFQNTGTDTAFTVVLLDTMNAFLDASKVRPGAASHTYDFDVLDGNVLRFRFDHILLPDSNVNEAASHGFVKFRVPQQVDNPIGTLIENRAGIYFDFNAPVMTNTTWHTIGDEFILVSTGQAGEQARHLRVYPNPGAEAVFFELPEPDAKRQFWLMDGLGRRVAQRAFPDPVFRFDRGQLPTGVYFYSITAANGLIASGKIVLR